MTHRLRGAAVCVVALALVSLASCSSDDGDDGGSSSAASSDQYRVTIRRTTDGVPHIRADDIGSMSFGQGWASFEDHSCDLADQLLRITSRRAEFFGPGEDDANIDSDFGWKAIDVVSRAAADWPRQTGEARDLITGFADGWNAALEETGADGISGWCAGQAWVQPITPELVYTYMRAITVQASGGAVIDYQGVAQPPGSPTTTAPAVTPTAAATGAAAASPASFSIPERTAALGSNGWAIGGDRTDDGNGMLLANPHFPWEGALRFSEVHLTVPGEVDVYGAQLTGIPGVGIGFTDGVAWTHTVSAGNRFTAYKLTLVPGKPTSYQYDGEEREMTSREETVKVLQPDGSTVDQSRTLWSSHYGPILDFPGVGWTDTQTITYRDANIDNDEFLQQYIDMNRAGSLEELQAAHERNNGVPLFNTIAVDADGTAWYADTSATPNLSDEAIEAWNAARENDALTGLAYENGAVMLDGSSSRDEWVEANGARDPGLVPYSEQPKVERDDYLFNANDSFWMPNAQHLLEGGYSPLHGLQDTQRSWRTRENAFVLDDASAAGPSGEDGAFDLDELTTAALRNGAGSSRILLDEVREVCSTAPAFLATACSTLAAWDGRFDLDSPGAVLWREFWASDLDLEFEQPFDASAPLETPAGIKDPAQVVAKLGQAVATLASVGAPVDATLRQLQHDGRMPPGSERIALHGGSHNEGVTNVVSYSPRNTTLESMPERPARVSENSPLTADGYWINYGTSFIMAVDFSDDGPAARSILTYGQTQDRTSDLFTVQTKRFAEKDWKQVAFTDAQIEEQQVGEPQVLNFDRG